MNAIITLSAQYLIVLSVIAALIVLFQLKTKKERINFLIALVAGGILSLLFAHIAGSLIYNPRPFVIGHFTPLIPHAADNGFPSDHALLAAFIGWTILRYSRKYGIITLLIAALLGLSRVLAGVHHSVDIMGSFVVSGLAVMLVIYVMNKIKYTRRNSLGLVSPKITAR